MTDLDEQLGQLRAELDARIQQPPPRVTIERTRARRRRLGGSALVVAALIGVITTGSLVRKAIPATVGPASPAASTTLGNSAGMPDGVTISRQPVASVPAQPATTTAGPAIVAPTSANAATYRAIQMIDMFDTTHGFAVIGVCQSGGPACVLSLRATSDGREWIEHRLPLPGRKQGSDTKDSVSINSLTALGRSAVYYEAQASDTQAPTGFLSPNSGRTWTPVAVEVAGTTQTIPAGAALRASCPPGPTDPCLTMALTVRSASDGRLLKLAHQPDLVLSGANPAPLPDAAWWVSGTKGGRQAVAVSRNSGRTWITTVLPKVAGDYLFTSGITSAGGRLWALAIGQLPYVKNGLLAVYRSDDNGKTWTLPWIAKPSPSAAANYPADSVQQPRTSMGAGIAVGKTLTVCDEAVPQRGWRSTDGGVTFSETKCPGSGWIGLSRAGYYSVDGTQLMLSSNGTNWTKMQL